MKNLLNLKGLCRSSQLALNPDGQTTVERRSNDGHVRRHLPVGLTKLLSLFLLLTLNVGQVWGRTFSGDEIIYIKNISCSNLGNNLWKGADDHHMWLTFDESSTTSEAILCSGTDNTNTAIYAFVVPDGTYTTLKIHRGGSVGSDWNVTYAINIDASKNYISGNYNNNALTATWETYGGTTLSRFAQGTVLYLSCKWDNGNNDWTKENARFAAYFYDGVHSEWANMSAVPNTDYYYVSVPTRSYPRVIFCRMNGSKNENEWGNRYNQSPDLGVDGNKNMCEITGWSATNSWKSTPYAPTMSAVTLSDNGTVNHGGDGTFGSPYLVYEGATIKVSASGTKAVADPNASIYYNFKQGSTSQQNGTGTTYQFTAGAAGTDYTINLDGYTKIGSTSSTTKAATAVYYRVEAVPVTPYVTLEASKTTGINVGETITITATAHNTSATNYNFKEGETSKQSGASSTFYYTPTTVGNKTITVVMTHAGGTVEASVDLTLNTPSVATLTESGSTTEMWIGENATSPLTFSATSANVGSSAGVTWSISDASSGTFTESTAGSYSGKAWTYTPASTGAKTITVTMSVGGNNYTKTYNLTVYERWNIYVHDVQGWGKMDIYSYTDEAHGTWPGTSCSTYNGTSSWYTVTLDSKGTKFILNKHGEQTESSDVKTADLTTGTSSGTYAAGTYWYIDNFKGGSLQSVTVSDPTVVISSFTVINTNQIKVIGNITDCGGDGTAASDMKEVGFMIGETTYSASCLDGTSFTRYITGLTAGTTYSVKAYAENVHGTSESDPQSITTRATGTNTIKVRTAHGRTAPKVYAFTDETAADCNGAKTENVAWPGETMTKDITGTIYDWYEYELSNEFNYFIVSETGNDNKTNDFENTFGDKCYWYKATEETQGGRMGEMACPSVLPQLMLNAGDGIGGDFSYYDFGSTGDANIIQCKRTLSAKTEYLFKPVYNAEWFGKAGTNVTRAATTITELNASVEDNLAMTTDAAGEYTFKFNTSTKAIEVEYPEAYTVTFGADAGGVCTGITASATSAGGSMTSGDYVAKDDDVTFTETHRGGYTFVGWYDAASGGSAVANMGVEDPVLEDIRADATVYPHYTENLSTITINANNAAYGSVKQGAAGSESALAWGGTISVGVDTHVRLHATPAAGYYFAGWTIEDAAFTMTGTAEGDPIATVSGPATAVTKTLTANFVELDKIYFRNINETTGGKLWNEDHIYVYFGVNWGRSGAKEDGVLSNGGKQAEMSPVSAGSNLYWAYVPRSFTTAVGEEKDKVAFSDKWMGSPAYPEGVYSEFWKNKAVYRTDYCKHLNMYVPACKTSGTSNETDYYSNGYWMKYNTTPEQGASYYLKENSGAGELSEFKVAAANGTTIYTQYHFNNTDAKTFYIANAAGKFYKASSNITSIAYADVNFVDDATPAGFTVTPTSEGYYTFYIDQSGDTMKISVNYPVSAGDYRLLYVYNNGANSHASDIIKPDNASSTHVKKSKYIKPTKTGVAYDDQLLLQKCTGINSDTKQPEWTAGLPISLDYFTAGQGVYEFDMTIMDGNGNSADVESVSLDNVKLYEGNYYIKTDYAPGGWANYTENVLSQNTINFDPSDANTFDYYHCAWVGTGAMNVKCIIANDYNQQLTDTLIGDDVLGSDGDKPRQYLAKAANVRFSYNSYTNELKRAYINGASGWEASFLMLYGESESIRKSSSDDSYEITFDDANNWVYQLDLEAKRNARYRLAANYKFDDNADGIETNHFQNFKGDKNVDWSDASTVQLIGSAADDWHPLRVIYDFKTNNLIIAWHPTGTTNISNTINLYTDVLLVHNRKAKTPTPGDEVSMVNLTGSAELTNINKVYSAFRFQKTTDATYVGLQDAPANTAESYYKYNYWISFPYDVKMTDIFGLPGYGSKWRIQYYDGAERASKGWYLGDGTTTFWKTMPMADDAKLNKGEGYVLQLSPSAFQSTATGNTLWENNVTELYLYFPSKASFGSIERNTSTVTLAEVGYKCSKGAFTDGTGKSHDITDSYWHVFGIPTFYTASGTTGTGTYYDGPDDSNGHGTTNVFYFYEYHNNGTIYNTYTVTGSSGYTFQPMHAYMIQMHGTLNFAINSVPASVAARQKKESQNYDLRLELSSDGQVADQTFVTLRENAVADFALNEDLTKIHNTGKANIYSYAGVYDVAANILPVENRTVVLGVETAKAGTYTFSMPDNFDGTVTLIDNFTQTRTNLAIEDYEVSLPKGEMNDRFLLEINIRQVPTAIDGVEGGSLKDGKAHKFIENGAMYILRDGQVFDARGNKVK